MIHIISNGLQKNWLFYRAMAEIINLPSWNIFNFMKRYYFQEKRGNGFVIQEIEDNDYKIEHG